MADPGNHRIKKLDAELNVKEIFGGAKFGFQQPKYFAIDATGIFYIADQGHHQIRVFDPQWQQIGVIAEAGGQKFNLPEGVAVLGKRVWISDTYNHRVVSFDIL